MTGLHIPSITTESMSLWIRVAMIGTIVTVIVRLKLLQSLRDFLREMVWTKWKIMKQMRQQGHSGPSFGLFTTSLPEMKELTRQARKDTLYASAGLSHDIMPILFPSLHTWINRYGDKFIYTNELRSRVSMYTTDPEALKEIFSDNFLQYRKPRISATFELFGNTGIIFSDREEWARQRKVVRPAFYLGRSKRIVEEMSSWIELWLQKLENSVAEKEGSFEMDMFVALEDLTKDILARSSFGSSFDKGKKAFDHQEKQRSLLYQLRVNSNPLLWLTGRPTTLKKAISKEKAELLKCLREMIADRRKSIQAENVESYGDDLLGLLLADRDKRLAEDGRPPGELEMEDEHLTDQCRTFFFAGAETVHSALSWATVLLGHYTDWQERIRAEVHEVLRGALPNGNDLAKLKQLEMFVQECLRLYPPAPYTNREVVGPNTSLLGEPLPQDLMIVINFLCINRDKRYWGGDALQFRPERFANGILQACKKPHAFDTFGFGPRTCVAQSFALTEMRLVLALLVQRFSFRLSPTYRHEPMFRMIMLPKFGVQLIMERIQPAK